MATIQRPLKEGTVRTYEAKVALGFPDILASEADADLDTIYAAWNGGVDSVNIKEGAVTQGKLGDGAVTNMKLADGAVTTPKIATGAVTVAEIAPNSATTGGNKATNSTELGITTSRILLNLPLTAYRGGHVLIGFSAQGWVAGAATAARMDIELWVNSAKMEIYPSQCLTVPSGTSLWSVGTMTLYVTTPGTQAIELRATRIQGDHDWRHIYSTLSILGLS